MGERFYLVLDHSQTLELQEAELLRTCGSWKYFRCVKSGFEWHEKSGFRSRSPEAAFRFYYDCTLMRLVRLAELAWRGKKDCFPEIRRCVGQLELARRQTGVSSCGGSRSSSM